MKTTSKRTKSLEQVAPTKKTKPHVIEVPLEEESKAPKVIFVERIIKNQFTKDEDYKLEKGKMHRVVLWLRNDLRLHDNAVINWAASQKNKEVIPVFCFDPRFYQREVKTYGTRKCGLIRTKFDIQSV